MVDKVDEVVEVKSVAHLIVTGLECLELVEPQTLALLLPLSRLAQQRPEPHLTEDLEVVLLVLQRLMLRV
jgi:hypothetical protein